MVPVVLSGGSGTRLWPLSRKKSPKQLCTIFEQSLLEKTLERLSPINTPWIITNSEQKDQTLALMKRLNLPVDHLVIEPASRNTAGAIALICKVFAEADKASEVVGVFPADHLITQQELLLDTLSHAERAARSGKIVTVSIKPTYPATGYGYIELAPDTSPTEGAALPVLSFREKPSVQLAQKFIEERRFFWNAGILVFRVDQMIAHLRHLCPNIWNAIDKTVLNSDSFASAYSGLENISIDYALLEKLGHTDLASVPAQFGWSDIGSWDAIADIKSQQPELFKATLVEEVESTDNVVLGDTKKLYAFVGASHLIVVDTKDVTLVVERGQAEKVKDLTAKLNPSLANLLLSHIDEERPWGGFEVLSDGPSFKTKIVTVESQQQISYQSHNKREEHWLITEGVGVVILDGIEHPVIRGSYIKIPLQSKHRIRNTGSNPLRFVEVQIGSYFGEDDIVRYQDDYQRVEKV